MTQPIAPLDGIKVLDLSRVLAGPWCAQMLGDLGADVIKVERPIAGDDTRHWGPPYLHTDDGEKTDQASYYTCCNRNKRSITIDMATPEGQALIVELARDADILVENFKVGGLKAYGLDYQSLKRINPRLIYCSVTGFGQTGPYAPRAGYDLMVQAMSGMMSITGHPDGEPGGGPLKVGVAVTDVFTGIFSCSSILAALHARHRTGEGQHIDMALLDVGMSVLANQAVGYLNANVIPERAGNIHPSVGPYQDFPSKDGNVLLAIGNDGQFARFCAATGNPGWAQDARFTKNSDRIINRKALAELLYPLMKTRTTAEWIKLLEDKAVPCGPINNIAEAFDDEQVKARGLHVQTPRNAGDGIGTISTVASPMRLTATPPVVRRPPPAMGQHTDEILAEMGRSQAEIAQLRESGVV
ncbi:crotonobetainyl-CoA:carnitine CoA-transferase CaiB-like acyl-CoA transferase [Comamonas odontotermitis]|uniref:Crotonobetainyl-CoA:carnitine CoA-transferase CaiB-like acyl-CoA transferase n=1 Tax=Comamonas odontotermitis TaxID=379895 RepID=A0ABR6RCR1_9BURK|nr:CaiB/BaiF CoA-transferase family protein [Comamonas odontotermitis]MBB6576930.1 crotonobetainyl-CoA:carnitine CoA-transferase CaiB-like acyl-CoA transferase [Comamonas odontotermitis]